LRGVIMIYVHLVDNDYRYEINELIRVFYFREDRFFIDSLDDYIEGFLIEVGIESNKSFTRVFKDHVLIRETTIDLNSIYIGDNDADKIRKIGIIQSLYDALNRFSPVKAPWGVLTGVRPVKIVHKLLDRGFEDTDILDILKGGYRLFDEKAELLLKVAKKQRKHIYPLDKDRFSLYIAIPFCPTRCLYCSFPSVGIERYGHLVDEYTDKLVYELDRMGEIAGSKHISTAYIGGGTPTAIPYKNLERIIQSVYRNFGRENIEEFTVEAGRPDTINEDVLFMLKENNIDRISINPQTMNDKTLELIGRSHRAKDIIDVYCLARKIGFPVINMDLIVGLPGEGVEEIRRTLDEIKSLDPENLTVHSLAVKRGSIFREVMDKYQIEDQRVINEMLNVVKDYTEKMELEPYYLYRQKQMLGNFENVGYAKKNKECIYNIKMMEEKETILAAGMGGISKIYYPEEDRIERVPNIKNLNEYLLRVDEMVERKKIFLS